ncbi:hypothetical protein BBJ28_00004243 [Nothophytophthora sp. Chile5]|nr:hypothetical protein BBJ28_00004243 [Nothophytophthora sp. Chile5]
MVASPSVSLVALAAATFAATANAHSYMILPLPTWPVSWGTNSPSGTIEGDTYLPVPDGMSYSTDPYDNTEAYWTAFNASNYTSLLQFAAATQVLQSVSSFGTATAACGFSLTNGTARDLPAEVEWNQLTSSHEGPCEVWCDDTLVFEDWNCALDYTSDPAKLPYDVAKCEGASMLTSIWLALHALPWQVYTNCAPLTGDLSSSVDASAVDDTATTTTTSASTAADASFTDDYATSDEASAASAAATTTATTTSSVASSTASAADAASTATTSDTTTSDETDASAASTTATTTTTPTTTTATPTATTATPTATTATPTATIATPTATSDTTSDKCSVRRHRRN